MLYLSILEKKLLWCHTTEIQPALPSEKGKKRKKKEFIVRFRVPWLDLMKNSKQKSKWARTFSPPLLSIPLTIGFISSHSLPVASSPPPGFRATLKAPKLSHYCSDTQKFFVLPASVPFPKFLGKNSYWSSLTGAHL